MLDILVAKVLLNRSRIVAIISELVAGRVTKHVRVNRKLELGHLSGSGDEFANG